MAVDLPLGCERPTGRRWYFTISRTVEIGGLLLLNATVSTYWPKRSVSPTPTICLSFDTPMINSPPSAFANPTIAAERSSGWMASSLNSVWRFSQFATRCSCSSLFIRRLDASGTWRNKSPANPATIHTIPLARKWRSDETTRTTSALLHWLSVCAKVAYIPTRSKEAAYGRFSRYPTEVRGMGQLTPRRRGLGQPPSARGGLAQSCRRGRLLRQARSYQDRQCRRHLYCSDGIHYAARRAGRCGARREAPGTSGGVAEGRRRVHRPPAALRGRPGDRRRSLRAHPRNGGLRDHGEAARRPQHPQRCDRACAAIRSARCRPQHRPSLTPHPDSRLDGGTTKGTARRRRQSFSRRRQSRWIAQAHTASDPPLLTRRLHRIRHTRSRHGTVPDPLLAGRASRGGHRTGKRHAWRQ